MGHLQGPGLSAIAVEHRWVCIKVNHIHDVIVNEKVDLTCMIKTGQMCFLKEKKRGADFRIVALNRRVVSILRIFNSYFVIEILFT